MTHRAEQIVDAAVAAIKASAPTSINVYSHRRIGLSEAANDLPAISVEFGEDRPLDPDGASNIAFIDSLLELNVIGIAAAVEEQDLKADLLALRSEIHVALMADRTLGLAFVADVRYGGAEAPDIDTEIDLLVGSISTQWFVHYRMNISDPT